MIRVLTERRCKPGKEKTVENMLRDLRGKAMHQTGYISGETLVGIDDPTSFLVISTWTQLDAWKAWENSRARQEIARLIDSLLTDEPRVHVYGPRLEEE